MKTLFQHSGLLACMLASVLAFSCVKEQGDSAVDKASGTITLSDTIDPPTKAQYVNVNATEFVVGTQIQLCVDYAHADSPSAKNEYASGVLFKKLSSGVFDSDYSLVWLNDYIFDVYAIYPHDVKLNIAADSKELAIDYYLIKPKYTTTPQYCEDSGGNWYATSGATIYRKEDEPKELAANPHDLITSMVLNSETAPTSNDITFETKYSDHGEYPVNLKFMHRLSRFEPYFVTGMGDSEDVKIKGIAIYPDVIEASFAAKRHTWNPTKTQDLFKYDDGKKGWVHRDSDSDPWGDSIITSGDWSPYFDAAPIKYLFKNPYELRSTEAVMAQDEVTVNENTVKPYVEFRMLPESTIDCMILLFQIGENDAYLPVQFKEEMNHDKEVKTQMGHTTRVVLSYKASMITLINVFYKEWSALPGRYVIGSAQIE